MSSLSSISPLEFSVCLLLKNGPLQPVIITFMAARAWELHFVKLLSQVKRHTASCIPACYCEIYDSIPSAPGRLLKILLFRPLSNRVWTSSGSIWSRFFLDVNLSRDLNSRMLHARVFLPALKASAQASVLDPRWCHIINIILMYAVHSLPGELHLVSGIFLA